MSQSAGYKSSGGVSGGVTTINGDIGSITGSTVTIFANNAAQQAGSSVLFDNSGTTSTLKVTDASSNTLIGNLAGNATLTGIQNTGLGFAVFNGLTTGNGNSSLGATALASLTTGGLNTSIGFSSLNLLDVGINNVAVGGNSLVNLAGAGASYNTAIGTTTATNLLGGSYNLALGYNAGSALNANEVGNIYLNHSGVSGESNVMRLGIQGNTNNQVNQCFIAGIVGVTTSNSEMVTIDSTTGQMGVAALPGANYSLTPYIVGQTGDVNAQFTGNDGIQNAITQARTDGHTSANPANIYIKPGTYSPVSGLIALSDGINLYGFSTIDSETGSDGLFNINQSVIINAGFTFTNTVSSLVTLTGVNLNPPGTFVFDGRNCTTVTLLLSDCSISAGITLQPQDAGTITASFDDCFILGSFLYQDATLKGSLYATFNKSNCSVSGINTASDAAATVQIGGYYSLLPSCSSTGNAILGYGQIVPIAFCRNGNVSDTSAIPANISAQYTDFSGLILQPTTGLNIRNCTFGNFLVSEQKAYHRYNANTQLTLLDNFVGVDTSSAWNMTLPNPASLGLTLTIKDATGTAGTHNITILPKAAETIDGAASFVITSNWGSATFTSDGTNWLVS